MFGHRICGVPTTPRGRGLLLLGLGMCEGVGEDSRHGIGHVDIQVGS